MVIAVVNHYQFLVHVSLTFFFACLSASYHVVHYLYIILMIIDSFFRVFPHKNCKCESQQQLWISLYISQVLFLYSQPFENTCSFQHEANIFDSIPVIYIWTGHCQNNPTRLCEPCQGNVILLHSLSFQQLKHMVPYSFGLFRIDFWITKVPEIITLYYKNRCRFSRMHTLETFLGMPMRHS